MLGFGAYVVLTGSMSPTFDAGSVIMTYDTPSEKLVVGDIITYKPLEGNEVNLTHRIITVNEENGKKVSFITQGDANNVADETPVDPNSIIGKTFFHMNNVGNMLVFVRTPLGIGVVIGLLVLKMIVEEILKRKAVKKNDGND